MSATSSNVVYRFYGEGGTLLYVGFTTNEKRRMYQHRRETRWFGEVVGVEVERFTTPGEAYQREQDLIVALLPRYNKQRAGERRVKTTFDLPYDLMMRFKRLTIANGDTMHDVLTKGVERFVAEHGHG